MNEALERVAAASLAAQGFQVNLNEQQLQDPGLARFTVILDSIVYQAPPSGVAGKLTLEVVLRAELQRDARIYKGRYQSQAERVLLEAFQEGMRSLGRNFDYIFNEQRLLAANG